MVKKTDDYEYKRLCVKTLIEVYNNCHQKKLLNNFLTDAAFRKCLRESDIDKILNILNTPKKPDSTRIPKILHYVWPGNDKKNDITQYCIKTLYDKLPPDWEIKEWNPDTFDFEKTAKDNRFFREVYKRKLYAFMVDYIRCYVLYEYGGVYLDTDVELIRPFTDEMLNCQMFLPIQSTELVEPAIWGSEKSHPFIKKILDVYDNDIWKIREYTMPEIVMRILKRDYGIYNFPEKQKQRVFSTSCGSITFYPEDYFIPFRWDGKYFPTYIKQNTTTIHWFYGSWKKDPVVLHFLKK
jgi:mannosyltransferase OCH1-like enzyme